MRELDQIGLDDGAPMLTDWKHYYTEFLVPTYHHQPLVARKVAPVIPVTFDGRKTAEIAKDEDIGDPVYNMEPLENDTNLSGDVDTLRLPQMTLTTNISDDEAKRPFAGRDRLNTWMAKAVKKIAQWEDIIAFRGDSTNNIIGFCGSNSKSLTASGKWDVDAGSNGVLSVAKTDLLQFINYFTDEGLGERPLHIVVTTYIYKLLRSTVRLYTTQTNLQFWLSLLPEGSTIQYSNNIQASVTADSNTMVALVQLQPEEKGAYSIYASGIEQKVRPSGLWSDRYGLREKFSVKVMDDAYVAYMASIDTTT